VRILGLNADNPELAPPHDIYGVVAVAEPLGPLILLWGIIAGLFVLLLFWGGRRWLAWRRRPKALDPMHSTLDRVFELLEPMTPNLLELPARPLALNAALRQYFGAAAGESYEPLNPAECLSMLTKHFGLSPEKKQSLAQFFAQIEKVVYAGERLQWQDIDTAFLKPLVLSIWDKKRTQPFQRAKEP
jgi:hypothetical protein